MPRHPIYLFLCAIGVAYLLWANARGYSPFYASQPSTAASRASGARLLHK